jgi:CRP/FNR family transcriptional regulator, anaerobic regulatory protein
VTDDDYLFGAMPFARRLSEESLNLLRKNVRRLSLPPKATLLQPGDAVSGAYYVRRGAVRIYYLDSNGREGTLYHVEAGDGCILALNCLFSKIEYPAWAEASEAGAECLALDGLTARNLSVNDPLFTQLLFEQLSSRLFQILTALESAIRLPLEGRLVGLLLELSDDKNAVSLSQERIADHLGTSREVISRILRKLAKGNLIRLSYGRIELVELDGLKLLL